MLSGIKILDRVKPLTYILRMSYYDDSPEFQIPDDYLPADEALDYVVDNHWDEILSILDEERSNEWLKESEPFLDLLSIVSRHDKDQLRAVIRLGIVDSRELLPDVVTDSQAFSVATDVSNFLEALGRAFPDRHHPANVIPGQFWLQRKPEAASFLLACIESCSLGEDLAWAKELVQLTRKFRDLLFTIAEGHEPLLRAQMLRDPLETLNQILQQNSDFQIGFWRAEDKSLHFARIPGNQSVSLTICIGGWFSNYLVNFYPSVKLAVCVECGTFFQRQRKDNIYCSKTCQNRVAYKRKKIFDTRALREINVDPDTADGIAPSLLLYHHRLGLGVVESVEYQKNIDALAVIAPDSFKAKYLAMRAKSIRVRIRFLHGVRTLGFAELFGNEKEGNLPHFYSVTEPELVAALF